MRGVEEIKKFFNVLLVLLILFINQSRECGGWDWDKQRLTQMQCSPTPFSPLNIQLEMAGRPGSNLENLVLEAQNCPVLRTVKVTANPHSSSL